MEVSPEIHGINFLHSSFILFFLRFSAHHSVEKNDTKQLIFRNAAEIKFLYARWLESLFCGRGKMEVWENPFPCTLHKCALKLFCTIIFDLRTCILVPGSWYVLAGSMVLKKPPDSVRNSRTAQVNGKKGPSVYVVFLNLG